MKGILKYDESEKRFVIQIQENQETEHFREGEKGDIEKTLLSEIKRRYFGENEECSFLIRFEGFYEIYDPLVIDKEDIYIVGACEQRFNKFLETIFKSLKEEEIKEIDVEMFFEEDARKRKRAIRTCPPM